jgi:GGDEF domain-containing protein
VDPLAPVPRGPRPVAGLPAVDARAVAKAWLLELVADAPLEAAAGLPAADLAREGPGLAGAVVAALGDEAALARLTPGGNLAWLAARAGALAGSPDAASVIGAVEGLRRAVTASLLAAARLDPTTTAEVVDRLAHVCSLVASAAVAELGPSRRAAAEEPAHADAPAAPEAPRPGAGPSDPDAHVGRDPGAPAAPPPDPELFEAATYVAPVPVGGPPDRVVVPESDDGPGGEVLALRRGHDPIEELRARATRQAESGSWRVAVERRIERHAQDGSPFALLAIEVDGLDRLLAAQTGVEVSVGLDSLERAMAGELRPADQLLREEQGRYWVTAPDTGPAVAKLLAERLAEAAGSAASHRGVPLAVSIGVATCPDDGEDADALAGRADQAVFAARAAGTTVA